MPNGTNGAKGFSEQYFGPGVTEEFATSLIAFNVQVGKEDDDLTDSVQKGLIGGVPGRGRFLTNSENLAVHFQRLIVNALTGEPGAMRADAPIAAEPDTRTVSALPDASKAPMEEEPNAYVPLEVFKIVRESEVISSFYLRRVDGRPLRHWEPGQFLPIRVNVPGQPKPVLRTYTLSTTANPNHYRLSIRRGDEGSVFSRYLHDNAKEGFRIEAMAPRGKFVLDRSTDNPVVLISGGVGITPMIAMATHIVEEGKQTGKFRPVYFIHGTNNGGTHAFGEHVKELKSQHPSFVSHILYSQPGGADKLGETHDSEGFVTMELLRKVLPFGQHDFYLCGPPGFMKSLHDGLTGLGIAKDRIRFESFGPSTVLKAKTNGQAVAPSPQAEAKPAAAPLEPAAAPAPAAVTAQMGGEPVTVRFAQSGKTVEWKPGMGTLLELAEDAGIAPAFACRSGICGTCATPIAAGDVHYVEEPIAPRGAGEVLLCCSIPRAGSGKQPDGDDVVGVVLEL
jgi:ferredoxin-NADP reductase